MKFEKLSNLVLTQSRQSSMLELFEEAATTTEIQTQVGGNWVHDAYDSDKPHVPSTMAEARERFAWRPFWNTRLEHVEHLIRRPVLRRRRQLKHRVTAIGA